MKWPNDLNETSEVYSAYPYILTQTQGINKPLPFYA